MSETTTIPEDPDPVPPPEPVPPAPDPVGDPPPDAAVAEEDGGEV